MNKKIVTLILLSFLSFFSPSSFAEGNCPQGSILLADKAP